MEILINVVLPLSLAIIMLSLGVGLTFADFARVLTRPKAFAIGASAQILLLPLAAYAICVLMNLPPEIAVGFMLLSICPGGVTSNIVSKLARGDVALSVTLTAVVSLATLLTVPALATFSVRHFMGADAPEVSVANLTLAVFLITTLPVLLGMLIRRAAPKLAQRIEPGLSLLAAILFVLIIVAAVAGNWDIFVTNLAALGPALILLNLALLIAGFALASWAALGRAERKTISIEVGIQNGTLGIALAGIISGQAEGFSTFALPSAVYGVTMYLCALPFVLWFRRH